MLLCRAWEPMAAEEVGDPKEYFDEYAASVMVDPTEGWNGWNGWIYVRACPRVNISLTTACSCTLP